MGRILDNPKEFFDNLSKEEFSKLLDDYGFEYKDKEDFKDNKYYTNSKDIVFCGTKETAKDIYDMYTKQGYKVVQSTVEIITGTHGRQVVKRLDILKY